MTDSGFVIEPMDPRMHITDEFSCGITRLDNSLARTAARHHKDNFAKVFVAVRAEAPQVLGYYALNAHSLSDQGLPDALKRRHPLTGVPVAFLSRLAVTQKAQGTGLGRLLLANALSRCLRASAEIGLKAVVLDALDDDGPVARDRRIAYYQRFGFQPFEPGSSRLFLPIHDIEVAWRPR